MSALYVCLIHPPYQVVAFAMPHTFCLVRLPYTFALYVCLICLPHMSALYVCLISKVSCGCDATSIYLQTQPGWSGFARGGESAAAGALIEFHRRRMAYFVGVVKRAIQPEVWGVLRECVCVCIYIYVYIYRERESGHGLSRHTEGRC